MKDKLKALVRKHGVVCVLCELRNLVAEEAADLEQEGDPADAPTVEKLEAVATKILAAACDYDAICDDALPIGPGGI